MKKGIFTAMHYFMPKKGILSLHAGCNKGMSGDVTLFFGLSGKHLSELDVKHDGWCHGCVTFVQHNLKTLKIMYNGCVGM
jgi:phosphoenolpyruvate carboxykinase (ATP)